MRILVLNTGSSSVKFKLFQMPEGVLVDSGLVERIGEPDQPVRNHEQALQQILDAVRTSEHQSGAGPLAAIGHRVVHGGAYFRSPVVADAGVMERLRELDTLAPLHNPPARTGIEVAQRLNPNLPHVLVFDTAFFHTLAPEAYRYALPAWCYDDLAIRRYGFHGTSHQYVSRQAAELLSRPLEELRMITLHLGNGASVAAIRGGVAIDTSMGLTPLEGLVMGTRSGDIDPAIFAFLQRRTPLSVDEVDRLLNRESGLLGLCGVSDMREVLRRESEGDADAALAVSIYVRRIQKYTGAYHAVLGGLDVLVFTAGVGEHSDVIRQRVCKSLEHLGIEMDASRNEMREPHMRRISSDASRVAALVVPTDEERAIAALVAELVQPTTS